MANRKLASIQKIISVESIPNTDRVEKAKVLGWELIVNKGQFKPGDLCIFFEIDAVVPDRPEFEFMRKMKFRVKTMKSPRLGVISQGLAMPIDILSEHNHLCISEDWFMNGIDVTGADVTELLGVTKYEPPISPQLKGLIRGNFPSHIIPKTDEIRLQSALGVLDELRGKEVYITEKEDGMSFTAYHTIEEIDGQPERRVGICSRNLEMKPEDTSLYTRISKQYDIDTKLKKFYQDTGINIAIQGEITGDGIKGNYLGLPRNVQQLHIFNVYNIDERKYFSIDEVSKICNKLQLKMVKTICVNNDFSYTLEELLELAKGKYCGTNNNREGIVIRPIEECYSKTLNGRLSVKVINNEYLLKEEK